MKKVTISLDEELAHWARRRAADENTSVSKLIARLLDREMRASDKYWQAYEAEIGANRKHARLWTDWLWQAPLYVSW